MAPLDVDPCAVSRTEIITTNTTLLTASEHAGGSLTEPLMALMASDSPVNSETSAPQIVNDPPTAPMASDSPANSETSSPQIVKDVAETKIERKNAQNLRCELCNVICNSEEMFKEHKEGKKHLKKMQQLSVSPTIIQQTLPEVANPNLDHESVKKKKEDSSQIEASVESLFVCNIPKLNTFTEHLQVEKLETQATCGPLVQSSNSGTEKMHDELNVSRFLFCEVCKVTCNSDKKFMEHNLGKKHLKNLGNSEKIQTTLSMATPPITSHVEKIGDSEEVKPGWCDICKITSRSNSISQHVQGQRHRKKLRELEKMTVLPLTRIDPVIIQPNDNVENPRLTKGEVVNPKEGSGHGCELCGVCCTSVDELNKHILGKRHKRAVNKKEKVNGHGDALAAERLLKDMMDYEGKVVILETGKRKANGSLASEEEVDVKRKKVVNEGEVLGPSMTCKTCNVACTSVMAFVDHLAGQEHSAMALKQVKAG